MTRQKSEASSTPEPTPTEPVYSLTAYAVNAGRGGYIAGMTSHAESKGIVSKKLTRAEWDQLFKGYF